jgi:hypothetical protein
MTEMPDPGPLTDDAIFVNNGGWMTIIIHLREPFFPPPDHLLMQGCGFLLGGLLKITRFNAIPVTTIVAIAAIIPAVISASSFTSFITREMAGSFFST